MRNRFLLCLLLSLMMTVANYAQTASSLNQGLISYWKIDETTGSTVFDSKDTNHCTVLGGVTINQNGLINKAAAFTNTNSGLTTGKKASQLGIGGGASKSVSIWIKPDNSINGLTSPGIIDLGNRSNQRQFGIKYWASPAFWMFDSWYGTVRIGANNNNLADGIWHHIAVTYNESNHTVKTYLDGNFVTEDNTRILNTGDDYGFSIGIGSQGKFPGLIDEVGLWNRALSDNEVTSLFNYGQGLTYPFLFPCGSQLHDSRNGKIYPTINIGNVCWMAANLDLGTKISGIGNQTDNNNVEKFCYNDLDSNCNIYGGLYQWHELMQYTTTPGGQGLCPDGWHIPGEFDFLNLMSVQGGMEMAGGKMKEPGFNHWSHPNTGADNASGYTAIPGGYRDAFTNYSGQSNYSVFWTGNSDCNVSGKAYHLSFNSAALNNDNHGFSNAFSLRCIYDSCVGYSSANINIESTDTLICGGTTITFSANFENGGSSPTFQWFVNNVLQTGSNELTFTYTPFDHDTIWCQMVSNGSCIQNPVITSNKIIIIFAEPLIIEPFANIIMPSCYDSCNGIISDIVIIGGEMPYNYLWSNGTLTKDLNNICTGHYELIVTDINGCTSSANFYLSQPSPVQSVVSVHNPSCYNSCDGTIDIQVTGGTAPYQIIWNTGANYFYLEGLCSGVYSATISDINGCSITEEIFVESPIELEALLAPVTPTCNGYCNGEIQTFVTGGTPPYNYQWSNGSASASLENICAGDYSVTITDQNSCHLLYTLILEEPEELSMSAIITPESCLGFCDGSITLINPTGGTPPYMFNWSNNTSQMNNSGLCSGLYSVTMTDMNDCQIIGYYDVGTVQPVPVSITISPSFNPVLIGDSVSITASYSNAGSNPIFQWIVNGQNVGQNSPQFIYVPEDGDSVWCVLTSDQYCITSNPALSNVIVIGLTGLPCPEIPSINYEGKTYHTVAIGSQCWFRENLNFGQMINGSTNQTNNGTIEKYCFNDLESNCDVYGALYQWNEMMNYLSVEGSKGICPQGWHIPTLNDFSMLNNYLGGSQIAGGKMKEYGYNHWVSPNLGATNESGFTARGIGFRYSDGTFGGLDHNADFWSSTIGGTSSAFTNTVYFNTQSAQTFSLYVNYGYGVRCLKDTCSSYSNAGVSVSPSANPVCSGVNVTFNALSINGGNSPDYQWFLNNDEIQGATNSTYSFVPQNGQEISCRMISHAVCISNNPAFSNTVQMEVIPITIPGISIVASSNLVFLGEQVVVTATPVNSGTSPVYLWKVNNQNVGNNSPTYTFSPLNGDTIMCEMVSNQTCLNGNPALSGSITFVVTGAPCVGTPTISYGGQTYNAVQVGNQCWFKENLNIGTRINTPGNQTNNQIIEKYCYANNDTYCSTYGGLYQWGEAMNYSPSSNSNPSNIQGVCPSGWHIPSNEEWCQMETYLDASVNCSATGWIGTNAGSKIKKAGTTHWNSPNTGTNQSGFTALGSGIILSNSFGYLKVLSYMWTTTESSSIAAWYHGLENGQSGIRRLMGSKTDAFSIRCLRDETLPVNQLIQNNIIPANQVSCYNATQTLRFAGNGTVFQIHSGGSATLIAGQNILLYPGTMVNSGGYMHGYITPGGPWCLTPSMPGTATGTAESGSSGPSPFRLYPNPTSNTFTLEMQEEPEGTIIEIEIYNLIGEGILKDRFSSGRLHQYSLYDRQPGIYLVRVTYNGVVGMGKVVRQ